MISKALTSWDNNINKTKFMQLRIVVAYHALHYILFCVYVRSQILQRLTNEIIWFWNVGRHFLLDCCCVHFKHVPARRTITVGMPKKVCINPTRLFKWHVLRIANDEYTRVWHAANKFLLLHLIFIWLFASVQPLLVCLLYKSRKMKWTIIVRHSKKKRRIESYLPQNPPKKNTKLYCEALNFFLLNVFFFLVMLHQGRRMC